LIVWYKRSIGAIPGRMLWLDFKQNSPPNDGVDAIGANQEIKTMFLAALGGHLDLTDVLVIDLGNL